MNEEVKLFREAWTEEIDKLESALKVARERVHLMGETAEIIKRMERNAEDAEAIAVYEATGADKQINGKNEDSRKAQRAVFLAEARKNGDLAKFQADLAEAREDLARSELKHQEDLDTIKICEFKLRHVDALFRAMEV